MKDYAAEIASKPAPQLPPHMQKKFNKIEDKDVPKFDTSPKF